MGYNQKHRAKPDRMDKRPKDLIMSDRVRVPNFALRRVRELERQETRSEFAQAIAEKGCGTW